MSAPLRFIDNVGPNTAQAALLRLLPNALAVDVQVAFASGEGTRRLLRRLPRAREARVVVGLWQAVTEPIALRLLLGVQTRTSGRIQARVIVERFHRKLYVVSRRTRMNVIVGSANLTRNGLGVPDEFSALLDLKSSSTDGRAIRSTVAKWWERGQPLTADLVKRYEDFHKTLPTMSKVSSSELRRLLGRPPRGSAHPVLSSVDEHSTFWIDSISGYAREGTEQVINDETNWERHGWEWYSTGRRALRAGDRILLLDWAGTTPYVEIVEVKDSVKTATPTPDGRYFAAYKCLRRRKRHRLTPKVRGILRSVGLSRKNCSARVSARRWTELIAALNLE